VRKLALASVRACAVPSEVDAELRLPQRRVTAAGRHPVKKSSTTTPSTNFSRALFREHFFSRALFLEHEHFLFFARCLASLSSSTRRQRSVLHTLRRRWIASNSQGATQFVARLGSWVRALKEPQCLHVSWSNLNNVKFGMQSKLMSLPAKSLIAAFVLRIFAVCTTRRSTELRKKCSFGQKCSAFFFGEHGALALRASRGKWPFLWHSGLHVQCVPLCVGQAPQIAALQGTVRCCTGCFRGRRRVVDRAVRLCAVDMRVRKSQVQGRLASRRVCCNSEARFDALAASAVVSVVIDRDLRFR
jgi:hypothetical protein